MIAAAMGAVGLQFLGNYLQARTEKAAGEAQGIVDRANADAANKVRWANNGFLAAQASLSNLKRSIDNQQKLYAGGKAAEAIDTNILRLQDQAVNGSLDAQLRAAEQLGAVRAAAAASGVGGTTATMLQRTMELTAARAQQATEQREQYQTYDLLQQKVGLVRNTIMSLDEGQTFAPIDYRVDLAPIRVSQFAPSPFSQALLKTVTQSAGTLASMFGGGPSGGSSGGIGNTGDYSSGALLNGPMNTTFDTGKSFYGGSNSYGFFTSDASKGLASFQLQ